MAPHSHRHVGDAFKSSLCPEPGPFAFIIFSIISILWMFCQFCISFQLKKPSELFVQNSHDSTPKIIVSAIYAIVLGILLLDGCWFVTLYVWAIKAVYTAPTLGLMDLFSTVVAVVVWCLFLVALFVSGVWTIQVMIKQIFAMWANRGDIPDVSGSTKPKSLA
ncbi:hypothetical protein F5Y09DRAFT_296055 [Xylaria sp. FL1042]|nr:hypothetical protein F5Y09DRAFT_296055 [Xylaria sp. FL1042]